MNIKKHPILSTDNRRLCDLTYSDDNCEWIVRTGTGTTITTLTLSAMSGIYGQLEVPREEVSDDGEDTAYQLCPADINRKPVPSREEGMKFRNKIIHSMTGKPICELSLNEEDNTWGVTFHGKLYTTTLYLYFNGSFSHLEIPSEMLM